MKKTKKIPRKKLVQGDEVGQPREMTDKAPKGHLKLDGRISLIVRWRFCKMSLPTLIISCLLVLNIFALCCVKHKLCPVEVINISPKCHN